MKEGALKQEWHAHPLLKTTEGVRVRKALEKNRPPVMQAATWKKFVMIALAATGALGLKQLGTDAPTAPGHAQYMPIEKGGMLPLPEDTDALTAPIRAQAQAEKLADFEAFAQLYEAAVKQSKWLAKSFTAMDPSAQRYETAAFYSAMQKHHVDVTDEKTVTSALHNRQVIEDAFSADNFPGIEQEYLDDARNTYLKNLEGTAL